MADNPPVLAEPAISTTEATFQINNTKIDVSEFTLSVNDNINSLDHLKLGFETTISWNRYRF